MIVYSVHWFAIHKINYLKTSYSSHTLINSFYFSTFHGKNNRLKEGAGKEQINIQYDYIIAVPFH